MISPRVERFNTRGKIDFSTAKNGNWLMGRKNLGRRGRERLPAENPEKKNFRGGIHHKYLYLVLLIGQGIFLVKIFERRVGG
jgi:hypothetical protein